jgi:hypothetical protein
MRCVSRLSIPQNDPPMLCLRAERVAGCSQGTRVVVKYRSAGRGFPIRREYSFHSGGDAAATVLTAIRTSRRVARSSVSRPEWSIPRPSRSPFPAPEHRRCSSTIREAMESIRRGHWANRPSSRVAPPPTVMRYETRTASTATERRAIETRRASNHAGHTASWSSRHRAGCLLEGVRRSRTACCRHRRDCVLAHVHVCAKRRYDACSGSDGRAPVQDDRLSRSTLVEGSARQAQSTCGFCKSCRAATINQAGSHPRQALFAIEVR